MMTGQLKFKRLREGAIIPKRGSEGSGGLDLSACLDKPYAIIPGGRAVISTGLALEIPRGFCGFIFARSGLGVKHGIIPSNAVGVIDSDYRGEVHVGLINQSGKSYTIMPGERIAQLILLPVGMHEPVECDTLSDTPRDKGGFGSTGRK